MNDRSISILHCPWDGSNMGKQKPDGKLKWGVHRCVTYIQNITVIRTLDPDALAAIMDEFALAFGIYKVGTFRYKASSYWYTAYSFMTGESAYGGDSFELNELRNRWSIYYNWWNIQLKEEDIYYRRYLRIDTVIAYPNACTKRDSVLKDYEIRMPPFLDEKSLIIALRSWINCSSVSDIDIFVNKARTILTELFNRLSNDNLDMVGIIMVRIRNFLLYYLTEEGQDLLKDIK